jgi:hypothetical protein
MENQLEELVLLRNIAANTQSSGSGEGMDDLIPSKINSLEELLEFDEKLLDADFKKKMVCHFGFTHCVDRFIVLSLD